MTTNKWLKVSLANGGTALVLFGPGGVNVVEGIYGSGGAFQHTVLHAGPSGTVHVLESPGLLGQLLGVDGAATDWVA